MCREQLPDVVAGRDPAGACRWLKARLQLWLAAIEWANFDLAVWYRSVYDTMLPDAVQVADPFHVVQLANRALDECWRRVQTETLGRRGRKRGPLWLARRHLLMALERLTDDQPGELMGLLAAENPHREGWFAWNERAMVR